MKTTFLIIFSILFLGNQAFSEEYDSGFTAQHGGVIKKTNNGFLEYVEEKDRASVYFTGHDHKNVTNDKLSLSAIAMVNGKKYPVQLSFENDHYSISPANSYMHKEKTSLLVFTISFSGSVDRASFETKKH